jgi:hypothetical protein
LEQFKSSCLELINLVSRTGEKRMPEPVTHLLDTHAWVWLVKGEVQARPIANLPSGTILGLASIQVMAL